MPTWVSRSMVRARAGSPVRPWCSRRISPICFSMVWSGLSEVIGSWKMMVMSLPRTWRICDSDRPSSSWPLKRIEPVGWCAAGYGSSLSTDSAVTDLPEPDSPTSATVSPFLISNETRLTAIVSRTPWRNAMERSLTSSRLSKLASIGLPERLARIEGVAHGLADEDQQREHGGHRHEAADAEPRRLDVGLALREHLAERGRSGRQAEAE